MPVVYAKTDCTHTTSGCGCSTKVSSGCGCSTKSSNCKTGKCGNVHYVHDHHCYGCGKYNPDCTQAYHPHHHGYKVVYGHGIPVTGCC